MRALGLLGVAAVTLALLTLALLRPAPYAVNVGAPGDAYALTNFHRPEGAFRWSAQGARLLIPAAYDGPIELTLRLHGPPGATPALLRVERDGAPVAALSTTPEWRVYRVLLPPDRSPEAGLFGLERLELAIPAGYGPGDARPLGIALDALRVAPAPGETPVAAAAGRAAAIAWGLALAWAALALLAGWRSLAAGTLPPLILGVGLALWAWRAPLGFAWAVPTPPWALLVAATVLLAAVAWAGRRAQSAEAPGPPAGRVKVWASRLVSPLRIWAGIPKLWRAALVTLPATLLLPGLPAPLREAAALAIILLPGALAAWAIFPEERGLAERAFLAACGAIAVASLLMLALHALPGPTPGWLLVGLCCAISGLTIFNAPEPRPAATRARPDRAVVLALLVGAALRLWHLGGAEFQGDEARAMLLALGVATGDDALLLTHTKGPVEALLPAAVLVAAGGVSEWSARLPFALASLGALAGALTLMGRFVTDDRRLLAPGGEQSSATGGASAPGPSSLVVVALLAVDGFAVAFGRIVQYQSVVMLMMAGAFWCCWRFYAGGGGERRGLPVAAGLLAVGLLAHYDAAYVAPALAWLVVAGGLARGWRAGDWARGLAAPVLLGAALLASFYLPYVTSASFAQTADYLAGRAGQGDAGGPPFNNLPLYAAILAFYNAPPLAPLLAALVLGSVAALIALYVKPIGLGLLLAGGLALASMVQWLAPTTFALPGGGSWALLAFGLPLAGLCCLPGVPGSVRASALWFAAAWGAQAFLIAEPRTHFYAAHLPAALLAGLAAAALSAGRRPEAALRRAPAALALLVLVGGALYGQLVYLRQLPEYQRSFPAARPDWLRGPYGDTLPEAGYFGFPHRDGWKAAAELFRAGELQGRYDTNQNRWLAGWYLGGLATQCKGAPELYLIAEGEPTVYFPPGYHMQAEVTVGPGRAMAIYGPEPPAGPVRSYALEELAAAFDRQPRAPFDAGALLNQEPARC